MDLDIRDLAEVHNYIVSLPSETQRSVRNVLMRLAVCGGDFDGFYWDIKEHAHSLLMIDVVNLDAGVSDNLQRELERDGVTLYEKVG